MCRLLVSAAFVVAFFVAACQAPPAPPGAGSAPPGEASPSLPCGPRDAVLAVLEGEQEDLQDAGVTSGGLLAETFANPDSGTWTWVLTRPDGASCFLAWGGSWRALVDWSGEGAEGAPR